MLSRVLIVGTLTTVGLLCGLAPDLSNRAGTLVFSSVAYAQVISDEEVKNYAQAGLEIEQMRQKAHDEIKNIIGTEPPAIDCHNPASLNELTGNARNIAMDYCKHSEEVVKSKNLTIARFNAITVSQQSDPNLKKRIGDEVMRLQTAAH